MASAKEYGYFIKGSKISLLEKDTALDNDVNSRDYGPDVTNVRYTSPQSNVTDGIELEYIYSPLYSINKISSKDTTLDKYYNSSNFLAIGDSTGAADYTTAPTLLSVDDYIVLRKAGQFNGLHKIKAFINLGGTNNYIKTYTKFSGETTAQTFERTPDLYYDIDTLNDEDDTLPLSEYLSKAVVYYLKAKLAEDQGNFQLRDVMFKEFYRIVEKSDNAKIHTIRKVVAHSAAIR
jgi:hypothetical protein